MERDKLTQRLLRILRTIDSSVIPIPIREVYVFGSYARGALNPADLDLLIIHDRPSSEYSQRMNDELTEQGLGITEVLRRSVSRFRSDLLGPLRRPGEKTDFLVTEKLEYLISNESRIKPSDLVFLWSQSDRDFAAKVAAIRPDPAAGRAPRNHLVSLKRLSDHVETMEEVVEMVADGRLLLTRLPIAEIDTTTLNPVHSDKLARWQEIRIMGKQSMELLPYGMWWMEKHRQVCECPQQTEMYSKSGTHRVHFGRASVGWMVGIFESRPKVLRQCLIPHLSRTEPNELLVFARDPKWEGTETKSRRG